jgi:hypothetical protein
MRRPGQPVDGISVTLLAALGVVKHRHRVVVPAVLIVHHGRSLQLRLKFSAEQHPLLTNVLEEMIKLSFNKQCQ